MSDKFLVVDILDALTIRVAPKFKFTTGNEEIIDDRLRIQGLNASPDDQFIKHRLFSFLVNHEVNLFNPKIIEADRNGVRISCNVIVDNTDITYYFPELRPISVS